MCQVIQDLLLNYLSLWVVSNPLSLSGEAAQSVSFLVLSRLKYDVSLSPVPQASNREGTHEPYLPINHTSMPPDTEDSPSTFLCLQPIA